MPKISSWSVGRIMEKLAAFVQGRWTGWLKIHLSSGIIDKFKKEDDVD